MHTVQTQLSSAVSMGATSTSGILNLKASEGYCIHAIVSAGASPVGTLKLQGSVNYNSVTGVGDWFDLASPAPVAISADGDTVFNVSGVYYAWVRAVYTRTSGTATLNIYGFSKGVS